MVRGQIRLGTGTPEPSPAQLSLTGGSRWLEPQRFRPGPSPTEYAADPRRPQGRSPSRMRGCRPTCAVSISSSAIPATLSLADLTATAERPGIRTSPLAE